MTKSIEEIEDKLSTLDPQGLRSHVLDAVKKFKGNWVDLARYVAAVKKANAFREWGFVTFDSYCTRELKLRKQTVGKLLRSYKFLRKEEPTFLSAALSDGEPDRLPDYENVNILRRAQTRKEIKDDDYRKMRSAVLNSEVEPRELGRQYRSMLEAAREAEQDPEEAWKERRQQTLKRTLGSLKRVKNTLKTAGFLPDKGIELLDRLIREVETELTRE